MAIRSIKARLVAVVHAQLMEVAPELEVTPGQLANYTLDYVAQPEAWDDEPAIYGTDLYIAVRELADKEQQDRYYKPIRIERWLRRTQPNPQ